MNRIKKAATVLALAVVMMVTGCIESTTVVRVNTDGSGEIYVREFMSSEITSMMEGMGSMVEGMAQAMGSETETKLQGAGLSGMILDMAKNKAAEFGENVTMEDVREASNAQGWKGYQARYAFADVTVLNLSGTMSDAEEKKEEGKDVRYSFEFEPGDTATLRIVSTKPDASTEETVPDMAGELPPMEGFEDFNFGDTVKMEGMEGMEDMGAAMMGGMFGNMFKGMRMSLFVQVNGDVVETDAKHRSEKRDNIFTIMDMNMDAIMKNPEATKLLMNNDPDALNKLGEMGVEGLVMEEPGRTITIKFK